MVLSKSSWSWHRVCVGGNRGPIVVLFVVCFSVAKWLLLGEWTSAAAKRLWWQTTKVAENTRHAILKAQHTRTAIIRHASDNRESWVRCAAQVSWENTTGVGHGVCWTNVTQTQRLVRSANDAKSKVVCFGSCVYNVVYAQQQPPPPPPSTNHNHYQQAYANASQVLLGLCLGCVVFTYTATNDDAECIQLWRVWVY